MGLPTSLQSWSSRLPPLPIQVSRSANGRWRPLFACGARTHTTPPTAEATTTKTSWPCWSLLQRTINRMAPEKRKRLLIACLIMFLLVLNAQMLSMASTITTFSTTLESPLIFLNTLRGAGNQSTVISTGLNGTANITQSNHSGLQERNNFKIIILSMDRFASLQRLIQSLHRSDYRNDTVDLLVRFDLPKNPSATWRSQVDAFKSQVTSWPFGAVDVSVAPENMGLRKAWLTAWRPASATDQAIIFEDDITVAPMWYRWLQGARQAYQNRTNLAGISLQRQTLVPHKQHRNNVIPDNGGRPFLYRLVGSIGYAPVASKWLDFLDFAECALATKQAVETPHLVTSDWYNNLDQGGMWTQLFIYFCDYMNLYTMYAFPPNKQALAAHWREKGEHYGKSEGPDFALVSNTTSWKLEYPDNLPELDWDAHPSRPQAMKSVVISAAVGYKTPDFIRFAQNLRAHYEGEVVLLVSETAPAEVFQLLEKHNIRVVKTHEIGGPRASPAWYRVNQVRWQFYVSSCQKDKHDLCMAVDFRDSLFQDDPFRGMVAGDANTSVLHVFEHNLTMNNWHLEVAYNCLGHNEQLKGKRIINAGGFIASPLALPVVARWITETAKTCDDQVALNLGVYYKNLSAAVITHVQGEGSINNVAWGGTFRRDSRRRFLNHNCFPSPVAHQFDLIK